MANLLDLWKKAKEYIDTSVNDNKGWIQQGKFTPVKAVQQKVNYQMQTNPVNRALYTGIGSAANAIKSTVQTTPQMFKDYLWNPIKENPVLQPTAQRFENAVPAIGRTLNPFADKTNIKQNWEDSKKIGAAALTAYGLVKTPITAVVGGAVINPVIKLGTNIYENKKGQELNKQLNQYGQSRTDVPLFAQQTPYKEKPITQGVGQAIFEGAGQGLANAGTNKLTNSLVQYFSSSIPLLNKLTEESIKKGTPVVTDTLKESTKKFLNTVGKRLVKSAVIETAVESPIWATFTQTEQETYLEALQRETIQNLEMNVGMAGVQSLGDARSLMPIVKKSVDDAVTNYFKNAGSPENLKRQAGYIDFGGIKDQSSPIKTGGVSTPQNELLNEAKKYSNTDDFIDAKIFRDAHAAPGFDKTPVKQRMEDGGDYNLLEVVKGQHNQPSDYFDTTVGPRYYMYDDQQGMESLTVINNVKRGAKTVTAYRVVPKDIKVNKLIDGDWISLSKQYAIDHGEHRFGEGTYKIIKQEVPAKYVWWDGNDIREWGYDTGKTKNLSRSELKEIWNKSQISPESISKPEVKGVIPETPQMKAKMEYNKWLQEDLSKQNATTRFETSLTNNGEIQTPKNNVQPIQTTKASNIGTVEDGLRLEKTSWGLTPKNKLDRLLKAEDIYRKNGAEQQLQDIHPVIQRLKQDLGVIPEGKGIDKIQNVIDDFKKGKLKGHPLDNLPKDTQTINTNVSKFTDGTINFNERVGVKSYDTYWNKKIQNGERPPVLVSFEDGKLRVTDGNHRLTAYIQNGVTDIPTIFTNKAKQSLSSPSIPSVNQSQLEPNIGGERVKDELIKKIDNTPTGNFIETKSQYLDLGGNQQGKRSGGMVKGGMSDVSLKYKSTDSYGIKVPEPLNQITTRGKTIGEEIQIISNRGQLSANSYAKARNAGLSHNDAINFALYKTGVEEPFLKNIPQLQQSNRTAFKDLEISSTPWKPVIKSQSLKTGGVGEFKYGSNLKLSDAYGKNFLGYSIDNLEKAAKEKNYNLYESLLKRVDSVDNMDDKLKGMQSIMDDLFPIKSEIKQSTIKIKPSETIRIKPNEDLVKQFDKTIKIKPSEKIKIKAGNDQNLLNNQQNPLGTGKPSVFSSQGNGLRVPQSTSPTIKIKVGQPNQISSGKPPSEPIIPQIKLSDIEKKIYGSETKLGNTGNKTSVGLLGDKIRIVEIKANEIIAKGLTAKNPVIRTSATLFQDLFGGAGKSPGQLSQKAQFRGGTDYATKIAGDTQDYVYKLLNNNTKSLERVHAVLDPEISKIKVNENSLTASEKEALKLIREVSDYINDTNHSLGFISDELWQANRGGKYLARAYETFDYPPEVADFIKNKSLKFDINPFKKRTEMTDWKKENAITDPAYLIGKRLQQTLFNSEVKKYVDWATKNNLISDVQKPGFFQLSDSKAYGSAAGKWIRKDALEDIKGFFVTNDIGQKAYDILNWYDRNPIRRTQKMLKTVFNPAVRLGNKTGNYVFAWLNGINPVTFAKNRAWAKNALNTNDPIYRDAVQNGLTGSDITKADITRISAELKRGVTDPNTLQKISDWAKESYGRVDDVSKLAAFKSWLDRGVSPEEALNRTRRGFQDYNMVGMLYDIGAKMPFLGNPFVRFASESVRIVKNAAVDHPFRLAATLAAWKIFTEVMSRMTGETEEDKKTREGRVGASHLPFTNISTNVMTPYGEVNASRLLGFSTTFTPEDTGKLGSLGTDISKYSPFQNPLDARSYTNDPVIGPVISIATDKDFRGKSIADPKQNKYTGSLLTPSEQNMNKLSYGLRSYLPPSFTDLYNIGAATQGKENVYGQVKTPLQAILRTYPGVKVEQFGPEEAKATRQRNADYNAYELDYIQKQINAVKKQQAEGTITPQQAEKRIESLNKEKITSQSDSLRTFETSPEAPKDIMARISLATQATVTNPTNALKVVQAIFTEEKMRKLSGDTLIFERESNLNKTKEKGDALDHIIPLSLGGDNSDRNKRYISAEANQEKAKLETSLARKLANNEITGVEARKQIKDYMNKYSADYTPTSTNTKTTTESVGNIYTLTNEKTGKDTEIDLTFPTYPKLTGLTETDKELKADYYSALSKIKTNAGKLYDAGKITAQEYEDILVKIKGNKSKSGKGRKISIKATPKMKITKAKKVAKIAKVSIPKISYKITASKKKSLGFKIAKRPNLKSLTTKIVAPKLKYDVGKVPNIKIAKVQGLSVGTKLA